jgi:uncharacterized protein YukE
MDNAIKIETIRSEIEDIKANMESVQAHLANVTEGPAHDLYQSDLAEMKEELAAREKDLADALK